MLIHGFGEGAFIWNQVAPTIPETYRTVAIDLRGHGSSDWDPDARYTNEEFLLDTLSVIDALEIDRFSLVGHSLGGLLGINVAAKLKERVSSLVIVDFGQDASIAARNEARALFKAAFQDYGSPDAYLSWLIPRRPLLERQALEFLASNALCRRAEGHYTLKCDPALCKWLENSDNHHYDDLEDKLEAITCSSLIIRGAGSAILSDRSARRMAARLSRGYLRTIRGAGHAVMMDNPCEFSSVLTSFLECASANQM